jgi:endo-alpha-1,4-polygalactosaminidase (GH114 family)
MKRREEMHQVRNYALYYGVGKANELAEFDLVIVEPLGQTLSNITLMHQSGTIVIAYISVMEIHPDHACFEMLQDEDFLITNGQRLKNESYGTYLLDLRSSRWLGLLNHHIGKLLLHDAYDGIFLDTIGNVEMNQLSIGVQLIQEQAAISFIKQTRNVFPEAIIIQNNGLESLCLKVAPWIDAICWENPPFENNSAKKWMDMIITRLDTLKKEKGIQTMLLLEQLDLEENNKTSLAKKLAYTYGFLVYVAPFQYVSRVNIENTPQEISRSS